MSGPWHEGAKAQWAVIERAEPMVAQLVVAESAKDALKAFAANRPWWTVVERMDMKDNALPAYKCGPFTNEEDCRYELESESSVTFCLLTIDAKNEGYVAHECYMTQAPPADAIDVGGAYVEVT